ncbi:MAG: DUF4271 domain-containing protein [Saprospiraceae bacterium]|jgi:hypothetical protein|nr:DUF4271 domain-containing protein [Saprospiraceae bacterium]
MANITLLHRLIVGAALLLLASIATVGQDAANPFELQPRLPDPAADSVAAIPVSTNPFDIINIRPPGQQGRVPGLHIPAQKKVKVQSAKEKETNYRRFLFVSILVMFIILTLIVTIFRILIEKIWKAFINDNLLNQLHREQSSGLALAYLVLYLLFFINAGLFAFLAARHFGITISTSNLYSLLLCMGGVAGFFVAKHFVLWLVGFVFPISKEVDSYQFTIMIFNIVIGLILVPIILFIAYAPQSTTGLVVNGAFGLLGLIYLFLALRGLFIGNRFIADNKFHFLLYLCAVEIAPLLVIYKIAMFYGGS